MGKKLLVIFGVAAIAGYLFRDRIAAGALFLVEKANGLVFTDDESEEDSYEGLYVKKED